MKQRAIAKIVQGTVIAGSLLCLFAIRNADAQAAPQSDVVMAGWAVDPGMSPTYLSTKEVTTARWFYVAVTGPDKSNSTEFIVDGKSTNYPINFGGTALFYAKNLAAKIYLGNQPQYGNWRILTPEAVTAQNFPWSIFPETNKEVTAGVFDRKREVLVSFGNDLHGGDCQNGRLKVIVDDRTVTDANGNDLVLIQGGSSIVFGQTIRLSVSGTCVKDRVFGGTIKLM